MAFGRLPDGRTVDAITCENSQGVRVQILTYGGVIRTLHTPGASGVPGDIVLGYDTLEEYLANPFYFGALIGRNANRIARGELLVDETTYPLTINDPPNHLHGGARGLHATLWQADTFDDASGCGVVLTATSADGSDGYPGSVSARVTYTLDESCFSTSYHATTDAPTVVNLTQHSYFNLAGAAGATIVDHTLEIPALWYTPVDATLIPLGPHRDVSGTPFDFRTPHAIGRDLDVDDPQLVLGGGYDHNWVLDRRESGALERAAMLRDPSSGRSLEVLTTEPGLQVYAGGTLTSGLTGKGGASYPRYAGVALETQHFPDAPHHPDYPSTVLRPGETYTSRTEWHFSSEA